MNQASEWVYEVWIKLPFGFGLIRLKDKFRHLQYHKYGIWRKTVEGNITHERLYWPKSYTK